MLQARCRKNAYAWTLMLSAALWTFLIWRLSAQPGAVSEITSGGITARIARLLWDAPSEEQRTLLEHLVRKCAHMTEFMVLAMLLTSALDAWGFDRTPHVALLSTLLLAAADEAHQLSVPGRSGQVSDVAIDLAGAIVGLLLWHFLVRQKPSNDRVRVPRRIAGTRFYE